MTRAVRQTNIALDRPQDAAPRPFTDFAGQANIVLLGDPGAGPEIFEEPADLVFKIPLDLNEQSSADKKGFGRVTVEIFDVDFLVPPTLHDAGDSPPRRYDHSC